MSYEQEVTRLSARQIFADQHLSRYDWLSVAETREKPDVSVLHPNLEARQLLPKTGAYGPVAVYVSVSGAETLN